MSWEDPEFDEELETHLTLLADRFVRQGMTPDEARRAARRQFGNRSLLKEARREMSTFMSLETLRHDVRAGVRTMRRSPGLTAMIVLTLMLGIGANTALFSVVHAVLLKPLPYRDPDRLVYLAQRYLVDAVGAVGYLSWKRDARSFDMMAAFQPGNRDRVQDGISTPIPTLTISEQLERVFGVSPILGRDFRPEEVGFTPGASPRPLALVSDRFFRQYLGGDPAALGKVVNLSNIPHTVIGVLPPGFRFAPPGPFGPQADPDVVTNMLFDPGQLRGNGFAVQVVARLKPGVKFATARAEMETIHAALAAQNPGAPKTTLVMMPLHERIVGRARLSLVVLWAAVGFVLLVACVNVANLLLARASARRRETAVRTALGAGRVRLLRQFLVESMVLALAGGAAGVALAFWAIRIIVNQSPTGIPRLKDASLDWNVLAFSLAVCTATGLLSGLAPALASFRSDPGEMLKEGARTVSASGGRRRFQGLLVSVELALAVILLTGAGLMLKSLWVIRSQTAAFAPERVLTTALNFRQVARTGTDAYFGALVARIESLPGVRAAAVTNWAAGPLSIVGQPLPAADQAATIQEVRVTLNYPEALGVRLVSGRWLDQHDIENAPRVMVVNEALERWYRMRYPGTGPAIGKQIDPTGQPPYYTIVGVVSDFRSRPDVQAEPQAFVSYRQWSLNGLGALYVRTAPDPLTMANAIQRIIHERPGASMTRMQTLEDQLSGAIAPRRFQAALLVTFAGLAMLLSMVGAYGVLSYAVTERTHEIGVRMALGAGKRDVLGMVLGSALRLVSIGVAVGLVASWNLTRWMGSLLYGVKPTDPATYAAVSALLICVAILAAWVPARRAVRVDPVEALRYE